MTDNINSEPMLAWVCGWILFCVVACFFGYHAYRYFVEPHYVLALANGRAE